MTTQIDFLDYILFNLKDEDVIFSGTVWFNECDDFMGNEIIIYTNNKLDIQSKVLNLAKSYFNDSDEYLHMTDVLNVLTVYGPATVVISSPLSNNWEMDYSTMEYNNEEYTIPVYPQISTLYQMIVDYVNAKNTRYPNERYMLAYYINNNLIDIDTLTKDYDYVTRKLLEQYIAEVVFDFNSNFAYAIEDRDYIKDELALSIMNSCARQANNYCFGGTYVYTGHRGNILDLYCYHTSNIPDIETIVNKLFLNSGNVTHLYKNGSTYTIKFNDNPNPLIIRINTKEGTKHLPTGTMSYLPNLPVCEVNTDYTVCKILSRILKFDASLTVDEIAFCIHWITRGTPASQRILSYFPDLSENNFNSLEWAVYFAVEVNGHNFQDFNVGDPEYNIGYYLNSIY